MFVPWSCRTGKPVGIMPSLIIPRLQMGKTEARREWLACVQLGKCEICTGVGGFAVQSQPLGDTASPALFPETNKVLVLKAGTSWPKRRLTKAWMVSSVLEPRGASSSLSPLQTRGRVKGGTVRRTPLENKRFIPLSSRGIKENTYKVATNIKHNRVNTERL